MVHLVAPPGFPFSLFYKETVSSPSGPLLSMQQLFLHFFLKCRLPASNKWVVKAGITVLLTFSNRHSYAFFHECLPSSVIGRLLHRSLQNHCIALSNSYLDVVNIKNSSLAAIVLEPFSTILTTVSHCYLLHRGL